jgi:hypothetical protein
MTKTTETRFPARQAEVSGSRFMYFSTASVRVRTWSFR